MAFVVETGSRVTDSNALTSVAYADAYHADRQHIVWGGYSLAKKQACIIRATDYLQKRFSRRWRGTKVSSTQSLDWPRVSVFDSNRFLLASSNEIPKKLQQAVCEYALRAGILGEIAPDPVLPVPAQDLTSSNPVPTTEFASGPLLRITEKVDVIEETKIYEKNRDTTSVGTNRRLSSDLVTELNIPEYPAADLLLGDFLQSGSSRIVRG